MKNYANRLAAIEQALHEHHVNYLWITVCPGETPEQAEKRTLAEYGLASRPPFVLTVCTGHPDLDPQETGQTLHPPDELERKIQDEITKLKRLGLSDQEIESAIRAAEKT